MLLTAIYHILKKHEPYNPSLYKKDFEFPTTRQITVEEAISIVHRQGYMVMVDS